MKDPLYTPPKGLLAGCVDAPLVIVDVGARGGLQPHWRGIAEYVHWVGFEPDARSRDGLPTHGTGVPARSDVLHTALSNAPGRVTLYRTQDEGDSSLLRPNRPFLGQFGRPSRFDIVDAVDMDADTLDRQLSQVGVPPVDVIKLDTQGSELAILEGSTATLTTGVLAVDVEVEFSPLYEGQPLFADVDRLLRSYDLQLVDLVPKRWPYAAGDALHLSRGVVVWGDALYFPTFSRTIQALTHLQAHARAARLARACLVAVCYGLPDYAVALLDHARSEISHLEWQSLTEALTEWDRRATSPRVPVTIAVTPQEYRALRTSKAKTGMTPTRQIRRLVEDWERRSRNV